MMVSKAMDYVTHSPKLYAVVSGLMSLLFASQVFGWLDAVRALNTALSIVSIVVIVGVLIGWSEKIGQGQRIGMALIAAGLMLSLPSAYVPSGPFDSWAFMVSRLGLAIYIVSSYGPSFWRRLHDETKARELT